MANVLLASLGESPIVVTAMYELLLEKATQHNIESVDTVIVLHPKGGNVPLGYELVQEALKGRCKLEDVLLPFDDANNEEESYTFLQMLFQQLAMHQKNDDTVYMSLSGGRKNMSALMALVVPLFSCVKKLYQVLDKDEHKVEHHFESVGELYDLSDSDRKKALFPELDRLTLVDIPYGEKLRVSGQFLSYIYTLDDKQLGKLWEEHPHIAEATEFGRQLAQPDATGRILEVFVTQHVKEEFLDMRKHDVFHAQNFEDCFKQMRYADRLASLLSQHGRISHGSLLFHYYKRSKTAERPFYHTEPEGIHRYPKANVRRVIISGLAIEIEKVYEPDIEKLLALPLKPLVPVQELFSKEVVLIVPLGISPMIATQLYALLSNGGNTIREVALVYPEKSREVRDSVEIVQEAFEYERVIANIKATPISSLEDIVNEIDCATYQNELEETIANVTSRHPDCEIVLTLSGGRKSMAALAMFAAQRKEIHYVYHTLINGTELNRRIDKETTIKALNGENKRVRNDRLFLRAYAKSNEELHQKFSLFKVPVLPIAE